MPALIKRELFSLAINPVIYISALIFWLYCAYNFFFVNQFFIEGMGTIHTRFFFSAMPQISVLCIPALTMGLWAQEEAVSEKLPLSGIQLVFAKWLAVLIFYFLLIFVSLAIPFCASIFGDMDFFSLVSGMLGIIFFAASACAWGIMAALIFKNQASAFILSAVFLSTFNFIHLLPLRFNLSPLLGRLCNFFSFIWHFDSAAKGLLDSRDISFYLIFALIFLVSAAYKIESRKYGKNNQSAGKKQKKRLLFSLYFLFFALLINSQVFYLRGDISKNKFFSLADFSKQVVQKLDSHLKITYYLSDGLDKLYPQIQDVKEFLYAYSRQSKQISVHIEDPIRSGVEEEIKKAGVLSRQIQSTEKNRTSFDSVYSGIILEYEDSFAVIPFVLGIENLEFDILARLQPLIGAKPLSVFVLTGNGLSLDDDYRYLRPFLETAGFIVNEISSDDLQFSARLDMRLPLLILGSSALSSKTAANIQMLIEGGAKIFFAVSPARVNIYTDWQAEFLAQDSIIRLLKTYGIEIQDALIHDPSCERITMAGLDGKNYEYVQYPFFIKIFEQAAALNLNLFWPSPISLRQTDGWQLTSLASSSDKSWLQKPQKTDSDYLKTLNTNPFYAANMQPDLKTLGIYTVACAAEKSNSRLILVSDQYVFSRMVEYIENPHNFDFLVSSLLRLSGEDELLKLKNRSYANYAPDKITDSLLFDKTKNTVLGGLVFLFIFASFGTYSIFTFFRSKKFRKKNNEK